MFWGWLGLLELVLLIMEELEFRGIKPQFKIYMNSMQVAKKWILISNLFKNNKTLFAKAQKIEKNQSQVTLAVIPYEEEIDQGLHKIFQKVNDTYGHSGQNHKLLYPKTLTIDLVNKLKTFILPFEEQIIPASILLTRRETLTPIQMMEATISGLQSLDELHHMKLLHGNISPQTCYFFNRSCGSQTSTHFGVNILDIEQLASRNFGDQDSVITKLLFQSRHQSLEFEPSYKDDVESLLYVLMHMCCGGRLLPHSRYKQKLKSASVLKRWKLTEMYNEILQKIPEQLAVLIDLFVDLEEVSQIDKPNYAGMLKKVKYARDKLSSELIVGITEDFSIDKVRKQEQSEESDRELINGQEQEECDDIFEEDIHLHFRSTTGRINKVE